MLVRSRLLYNGTTGYSVGMASFFAIFVLGMIFNAFMRWDSDPMLQYVFLLMCDSRLELV